MATELAVRVTGNIDDLRKQLADASAVVQRTKQDIEDLGPASARTSGQVRDLRGSFRDFDGVLETLGIRLNREVRALEDISGAAGKTVGQLGLLATAGLAVGAALAGWKVGRMIAEFFDLDTAISNTTAKLLGFGDVAAQEAGAKADVLALASTRAGYAITSMAEAIAVNASWVKKHTAEVKEAEQYGKQWREAMEELNATGKGWQGTLETIDGETVAAIKYYLEAGVAQDKLATAYKLTAVQVKAVASAMEDEKKVAEATKAWLEAVQEIHIKTLQIAGQAEQKFHDEQMARLRERNQAVVDGFQQIRDAEIQLADLEDQTWMSATDFQIKKIWERANAEIASFKGTNEQREQFASKTLQVASRLSEDLYAKEAELADKTQAKLEDTGKKVEEVVQRVQTGVLSLQVALEQGAQYAASLDKLAVTPGSSLGFSKGPMVASTISVFDTRITGRASGGPVMEGETYVVGERGPEILSMGRNAGAISANGSGVTVMPGAVVINNPILNDPAGKRALYQIINEALTGRLTGTGIRLPQGA